MNSNENFNQIKNSQSIANTNLKKLICNDEFVNLVNILLDSIKEYFKVCKNVLKNKNTLISSLNIKYNKLESHINDLISNNIDSNLLNQFTDTISKLKEISSKLSLTSASDEKNLNFFFENAKTLSKKMKIIRQDNLEIFQKNQNVFNRLRANTPKKNVSSIINKTVDFYGNNLNFTEENNETSIEDIKNGSRNISQNKSCSQNNADHCCNLSDNSIDQKKSSRSSFLLDENDKIIKLKRINTKYFLYIRKLENELKANKINSFNNEFSIKDTNSLKNVNTETLIQENKKIMLKYNELLKFYKKTIEENTMLKNSKFNNLNQNINSAQGSSKQKYSERYSTTQNSKEYINKLMKEIEIRNKKLSETNNLLANERKKILNIQNILNKSNNEYKKDISIKTKNNLELSKLLSSKNEELSILQKENNEKNNTIENLKNIINRLKLNSDNLQNSNDNNSKTSDSIKQNEQLKLINQSLEKTIENYKLQLDNCMKELNNRFNNSENSFSLMKNYYETLKKELKNRIQFLENNLSNYRESNSKLTKQIETLLQEISDLKNKTSQNSEISDQENNNNNNSNNNDKNIKDLIKENTTLKSQNESFSQKIIKLVQENLKLNETNKKNLATIKEYEEKLNQKLDEITGLNQLVYKFQFEREKSDELLKIVEKENQKLKQQNGTTNQETVNINSYNSLVKELQEAKNQIKSLKKKNEELIKQLEDKEVKKECFNNKSDNGNLSNYEEEFDLRKLAKGVKEKIRSQDINIDYPGLQQIKDKYRELDFYYNSLESLVKRLLLNIKCETKNKTYVTELCRIVGFDLDTTNKIVSNKVKKNMIGILQK